MLSQHSTLCALDISAPSLVDLHALSLVANTAACALDMFAKWLIQKNSEKFSCEEKKTGRSTAACSDAMGGKRLDTPEMGVMEETTPARQLQLQGNHKSQLVGWERDAI